jgi:hypothetical protein
MKAGYECTGMEWIHANFSANREDKEHLAPEYRDANMYNWEQDYYENNNPD